MATSLFLQTNLWEIGWSRLILFFVAILMSANVFSKTFELVPGGKVLELITKEEAAVLEGDGVDLFDESEARADELCTLVGKSLYSLIFVPYGIHIKKEHICQKTQIVIPTSSISEYVQATGFILAVSCGVFVVLPASLCDIYCPESYYADARIAAAAGLSGMIGGMAAFVATGFSEIFPLFYCGKNEETDDDSFTCSDSEEEESESPDPVLVKSLKCV